MAPTSATADARLREAVLRSTGTDLADLDPDLLLDPRRLRCALEQQLGEALRAVHVAGTLDRRLVLLQMPDQSWTAADLSGRSHTSRDWPQWTMGHLNVHDPRSWFSSADVDGHALRRLSGPRMLLVALYHPENFPLPRFALGIHDLARAARSTLMGEVELADMQLGTTMEELIARLRAEQPDIVGISATFGQHDLLTRLLQEIEELPLTPRTIAGGSLTARNERLLIRGYPWMLIARGAGEPTIAGLLANWHGDVEIDQVPGLGYEGSAWGGGLAVGKRRTARALSQTSAAQPWPELDLLPETFRAGGVAQLETSRGCTNYCSFCPRGHKGTWAGAEVEELPWVLGEMAEVFGRHPAVSRTLYLVDEEFIGRDAGAAGRALEVAGHVHQAGFRWESSCRVDQIVHPGKGEEWHAGRVRFWRELLERGLRRMLFGVESGVDSILERFNKETTGSQNALAIRTLSALGVPTRFTYITFDQLMTLPELKATHAFQGRTDLLLQAQPDMPAAELVRAVRDEEFVAAHATGQPLHTAISYPLVSMEPLIGAAYTHAVKAAGLAGAEHPAMGRMQARFADWRIGVASHHAQLWVDRSFALDYTFKSLEKVLDGPVRHIVRQARVVLKDSAYALLGQMIGALEETPAEHSAVAGQVLAAQMTTLLTQEMAVLQQRMERTVQEVCPALDAQYAQALRRQHERWRAATEWRLINASDSCGN